MTRKHPIRRRLMWLGFQGLRGLAWLLPAGLARAVGRGVGWGAYALLWEQRRLTLEHLAFALGEAVPAAERRRIARRLFRHLGCNAMEWLRLSRLTLADIHGMIDAEGVEHVRAALDRGAGAIMVTAHFGNWELLPLYFRSLGYERGGVLARPLRYPEYESFLIGLRAAKGVPTIARGSLKEVARALRENGLVGMLPDQDIASMDGVFVQFFGHPAYTPVGPAALSLMTGAPIIPCFIRRDGRRFRVVVEPPLTAPEGVERSEALIRLTQAWSDAMERHIRQHPDHWVWMHRRWKTRPEVEDSTKHTALSTRPHDSSAARQARRIQPAVALLCLLSAYCLVLSAGCSGSSASKSTRATADATDEDADQRMSGFTLTGYEPDGSKRWELDGTGMSADGDTMTIQRPNGVGYDFRRTAYLTADVAHVDQRTRNVRLEKDVAIHTSDGLWLFAPVLHWIPDQDRLTTDTPVKIETDHMLVRGRGANGLTQLKHVTLLEDVELILNPSEHETADDPRRHVRITCDGPLTFDYENQIATFEKNVHVEDPNGDLFSDKLVAYLNEETRTIRYAEAIGNVRMHQEQNTARSTRAIYEPHLGTITLVGKPSLLIFPSDQNRGAQLSFGGLAADTQPVAP